MEYKIYAYKGQDKFDISNIITSINWHGDEPTFYRTLELALHNNKDNKRLFTYSAGMLLKFFYGSKERFRGYLFTYDRDGQGNENWACYDEGIYLYKNSESLLVKNKKASTVITSLCKKYGISIGKIDDTSVIIKKKVFNSSTIAEIITELLNETYKLTGQKYKVYVSEGKLYVKKRSNATTITSTIKDLTNINRSTSIEETRNQIKVVAGDVEEGKIKTYTVKDKDRIKKYGIMQHVEEVDDKVNLKKKAESLLRSLSKADVITEIETYGLIDCVTSKKLKIDDWNETYYISSDNHVFENGTHKMQLQLSKKLHNRVGDV